MSLYTDKADIKILKITEYLNFSEIGDTGKTKIIGVGNNSGVKVGLIKWVGAWRKYCFFPEPDTFFDSKCLEDLKAFMGAMMTARLVESKKKSGELNLDEIDLFVRAYTS